MMLRFTVMFNVIRTLWKKLQYGSRFDVSIIERFHHSVCISLYDKASISIARNIEISKDSDIKCFGNAKCSIGAHTYANQRLMISCHAGVSIGENCLFGPDVKIFDNNHVFSADRGVGTELKSSPVVIGNNCWIASNVVILKGTVIGDNCVIGAGCVVSGNIPPKSIVKSKDNNVVIPMM